MNDLDKKFAGVPGIGNWQPVSVDPVETEVFKDTIKCIRLALENRNFEMAASLLSLAFHIENPKRKVMEAPQAIADLKPGSWVPDSKC